MNMRMRKVPGQMAVTQLLFAIIALCAYGSVNAQCVEDEGAVTLLVDATSGCDNVVGQVGCTIDFNKGETSCQYPEISDTPEFTATAYLDDIGKTVWEVTQGAGIDLAIVSGGIKGNNCGYAYKYDTYAGSGGYLKGSSYQNTNSVSFCTDQKSEPAPAPATAFPICSPPSAATIAEATTVLDKTTVLCGPDSDGDGFSDEKALVCNFQLESPQGGALLNEYCCVCGVNPADVEVCNAGTGECDGILGDGTGTKSVHIDQGETLELLYTPSCVYSKARQTWLCF